MLGSMKLSVSLPDADIKVLDDYVRDHAGATRSSALHSAVTALRDVSLDEQYRLAAQEWIGAGNAAEWDAVSGDGIPSAGAAAPVSPARAG
jgi:antitoxin MazE9